jgi:hypothetical protein
MDALDEVSGELVPLRSVDLNPCDFPYVGDAEKKTYVKNTQSLEKLYNVLGMKFPLFLYSSLDVFVETYSHDARRTQKRRVVTSRPFCKIR